MIAVPEFSQYLVANRVQEEDIPMTMTVGLRENKTGFQGEEVRDKFIALQ